MMRPCAPLLAVLQATVALAHATGQTGAAGLTRATCNDCHVGGVPPVVALEGPTRLEPGVGAPITVRVSLSREVVGLNVAASGNLVLEPLPEVGLRREQGELVHERPLPLVSGAGTYAFMVRAAGPGTVTVSASVLSANGDGRVTGDAAASARLRLVVEAPVEQPETPTRAEPAPEVSGPPARGCSLTPPGPASAFAWWLLRVRRRPRVLQR